MIRREYYRYWVLEYGSDIYHLKGVHGLENKNNQADNEMIDAWKTGNTGMPIIDALMRQLNKTGYISAMGRQMLANYFSVDLK